MSKIHKLLVFAAMAIGMHHAYAGGPAAGGASEWTQILNNFQLVKVSGESSATAFNTANQYITQIQQYRAQLLNMKSMDPTQIASQVATIDRQISSLTTYQSALQRSQGSLSAQQNAWQERYTAAKLNNRTIEQQLTAEAQLRDQRNSAALQRAARDQQILQDTNDDIAALRAAEVDIPASVSTNESVQKLHRTMNRIAVQNTRMIELQVAANSNAIDAQGDKTTEQAKAEKLAKDRQAREEDIFNRQKKFIDTLPK